MCSRDPRDARPRPHPRRLFGPGPVSPEAARSSRGWRIVTGSAAVRGRLVAGPDRQNVRSGQLRGTQTVALRQMMRKLMRGNRAGVMHRDPFGIPVTTGQRMPSRRERAGLGRVVIQQANGGSVRRLRHTHGRNMRTLATFALGTVIALGLPASLQAQRQGAVEIGGFGRFTSFGDSQKLDAAFGGGGRAGVYVLQEPAARNGSLLRRCRRQPSAHRYRRVRLAQPRVARPVELSSHLQRSRSATRSSC